MSRLERLAADYENTNIGELASFKQFVFVLNVLEDVPAAAQLLANLSRNYTGSESAQMAQVLFQL